ncbi:MAG: hypothetical protein RR620_12030 [Clostridium sp.]
MKEQDKKNKVGIMVCGIVAYIGYSYYKYGIISNFPPVVLFVKIIDKLVIKIDMLTDNIIDAFSNSDIIKWCLLLIVIVYILSKLDLNKIFSNIDEINWKQQYIRMKAEQLDKNQELKKQELQKNETSSSIDDVEIVKIDKRLEIIKLIKEYPYIAKLIDKWVNNKITKVHIPLSNLISNVGDPSLIDNIFEYNLKNNTIVLTGLNEQYKTEIIEVYKELFKK